MYMAPQLPPSFQFSFTLRPKNEKPLTAKKLPPYCITAEQIPPYFGLPLPPKSLPPKNLKKRRLPPKQYRRIALPPKKYRHFLLYRFRQNRHRQKRETRHPPKITTVWQHRPACVRLKNRYRRPPNKICVFCIHIASSAGPGKQKSF